MTYARNCRESLGFIGRHFMLAACVCKFIFPFHDRFVSAGNIVPERKRVTDRISTNHRHNPSLIPHAFPLSRSVGISPEPVGAVAAARSAPESPRSEEHT